MLLPRLLVDPEHEAKQAMDLGDLGRDRGGALQQLQRGVDLSAAQRSRRAGDARPILGRTRQQRIAGDRLRRIDASAAS